MFRSTIETFRWSEYDVCNSGKNKSIQGKVFHKFKEKEKFIELIKQFTIYKTIMTFKINIVKLIDKYPNLMKPSVTLIFFPNYFKGIKYVVKI